MAGPNQLNPGQEYGATREVSNSAAHSGFCFLNGLYPGPLPKPCPPRCFDLAVMMSVKQAKIKNADCPVVTHFENRQGLIVSTVKL
jgi:hypothetical protein